MVVSPRKRELFISLRESVADSPQLAQVHRGAVYWPDLPGRDRLRVGRREGRGVDPDPVVLDRPRPVPVEVEIAVIRQIADGVALADGPVFDPERAAREPVGYLDAHRPGNAARPVRVGAAEGHGIFRDRLHGPERGVQPGAAAVQAVLPVVPVEGERPAADRAARPGDPVRRRANRRADVAGLVDIIFNRVEAEHNVGHTPVPVRHAQGAERRAEGQDLRAAYPVCDRNARDRPAAELSEDLHMVLLSSGRAGTESAPACVIQTPER